MGHNFGAKSLLPNFSAWEPPRHPAWRMDFFFPAQAQPPDTSRQIGCIKWYSNFILFFILLSRTRNWNRISNTAYDSWFFWCLISLSRVLFSLDSLVYEEVWNDPLTPGMGPVLSRAGLYGLKLGPLEPFKFEPNPFKHQMTFSDLGEPFQTLAYIHVGPLCTSWAISPKISPIRSQWVCLLLAWTI